MRSIFLTVIFVVFSSQVKAQDKTITIVCEVHHGEVKYAKLEKYLPDSLKYMLIKPKRTTHFEPLDIVNILTMHGWQIIGPTPIMSSAPNFGASTNTAYLLKYEIRVSDMEYEAIRKRMKIN
jgi:hypothetical protein